MVSRTPTEPPVFDDPTSYVLKVAAGEVSLDLPSLENLLNERVFAGPHSPLSDIHVSITKDGLLQQSAKLHKGPVTLPVSMKATVGTSPDGRLKLHVDTEKTLGIPTTGLLSIFGLTVEDLVSLKNTTGVEIDGNDLFIQIGLVTPPPEIQGRLASVTIRGNRLVETFVKDAAIADAPLHLPVAVHNYLYFSGSVLRFGKLTMNGADLMLVDEDQEESVRFLPARVLEAAGRRLLQDDAVGWSHRLPARLREGQSITVVVNDEARGHGLRRPWPRGRGRAGAARASRPRGWTPDGIRAGRPRAELEFAERDRDRQPRGAHGREDAADQPHQQGVDQSLREERREVTAKAKAT